MPCRFALIGARSDLTDAAEIIALMAQDLNDLRREDGHATHESLFAKGWTRNQVKRCFQPALEEAFRTYSETRASPEAHAQAAPFIDFDREMKAILDKAYSPGGAA